MNTNRFITLFFSLLLSSSISAGLIDRGNGMIYDDVLDITWLQDANYAHTSGYAATNATAPSLDTPGLIRVDGAMGWEAANIWADQLVYGRYDDWRLPSVNFLNASNPCNAFDGSCDRGYNNTRGELGHMFHNNLGNLSYFDINGIGPQAGYGLSNTSSGTVSLLNMQRYYWYGEEFSPDTNYAMVFANANGVQGTSLKNNNFFYSWAVRDGDVCSKPGNGNGHGHGHHKGKGKGHCGHVSVTEPNSLALLALGLGGLALRRRPRQFSRDSYFWR